MRPAASRRSGQNESAAVRIRRKSDLAVIGTYEYDGICRRIAKSTSAGTVSFYWIGFELAMEYDASGIVSSNSARTGFASSSGNMTPCRGQSGEQGFSVCVDFELTNAFCAGGRPFFVSAHE